MVRSFFPIHPRCKEDAHELERSCMWRCTISSVLKKISVAVEAAGYRGVSQKYGPRCIQFCISGKEKNAFILNLGHLEYKK